MKLVRSSGVQLHPTSLPRGDWARKPTRSSTGCTPRASRGGRCCRSARPTATARRTRPSRRSRRGPGCSAEPRAPVTKARGARLPRAQRRLDRRLDRPRRPRSARRPGPLRPRVGRAAPLRARPRRQADRRRPDLRRARQRRPQGPPGALPGRRRRGHAARRVHRQGPAVGQPALRLAGAAAARLPLVDRAPAAHLRPLRPRPRRPLPRLRLLLVGARAAPAMRCPGTGSAGPGRAVFDAAAAELGELRPDRGGPRRHHPGGGAPARRPRLPGHGDPAVPLRPGPALAAQPRQPSRAPGRLHRHPRPRHAAGLVPLAAGRTAAREVDAADRRSGDGSALAADRARVLLARRAWRWCRPRTCSGSAPRPA